MTLAALIGAFPVVASATVAPALTLVSQPDVFITEFQTNGGSASQEFVELYNATDHDINLADAAAAGAGQWKLQFFNSTAVKSGSPTWTTSATASNTVTLSGMISAHDYYLLSSTGYAPGAVQPDQTYDAASSHLMTDTGGGLQLLSVSASGTPLTSSVHDRIMWLPASPGTPLPTGLLATPSVGKSLQRLPNDDNEYVNPDKTLTDFSTSDTISPLDSWQPPAPVPPVVVPGTGSDGSSDGVDTSADPGTLNPGNPVDNSGLKAPQITELLANPGSPLTDAADEYIELYNPNHAPFDLKGYSLEVGTTTLHDYTFADDIILAPDSYQAFYSASTHLSLVNSGDQARVLDPSGAAVSETAAYGAAADNTAWALSGITWQWTTTPTPNAPNSITSTPVAAKATAVTKSSTATAAKTTAVKKAAAKTTTTKAKTTTKKAAAKKTVKKKKAAPKKTAHLSTTAAVKPKPPIHAGILVGVAVAAVLYGLYEYRHDLSNKFHQLRENRAARRGGRGQAAWRRGYSPE